MINWKQKQVTKWFKKKLYQGYPDPGLPIPLFYLPVQQYYKK